MKQRDYTDEWGVTYTKGGRVLSDIDSDKFLCEEYTIPEGVERIEYAFMMIETKNLRKIHLPSTLRHMCDNTFIDCPIEEIELPEGMTKVAGCMCENCRELKKVTLPSTIKVIRNAAFCHCSNPAFTRNAVGIHCQKHFIFGNLEGAFKGALLGTCNLR